jgi:hypothetical protein
MASCNDDIDQYCSKFTQARDEQIIVNGEDHIKNNLTEDNLVTHFISGLTASSMFDTFVLNFRQKEKILTLEETMSLVREEARISRSGTKNDLIILYTQQKQKQNTNKRKQRGNCSKHPGTSHNEEDR